jgi:hypothetical protein
MKYPLKKDRNYRNDRVVQVTARNFGFDIENGLVKLRAKQMKQQLFERLHLKTTHQILSIGGLIEAGPMLF